MKFKKKLFTVGKNIVPSKLIKPTIQLQVSFIYNTPTTFSFPVFDHCFEPFDISSRYFTV